MRHLSILALVMLLICGVTLPLVAQGIAGKIVVVSVPDRYKTGNGGQSTNGLPVVGIGARAVLKATALGNANVAPSWRYNDTNLVVTSATWTITSPSGSTVTALTDTTAGGNSGKVVYFVPDKKGQYVVTMTATTPKGVCAQVSVSITAAMWVGVGISQTWSSGLPPGCMCHGFDNTPFTSWKKSNHATAFKRKVDNIDGTGAPLPAAGHFTASCMSCHSAGAYGQNGYADYKTKLGFTLPAWNHAGVFDSLVTESNKGTAYADSLKKMLSMTSIGCENCHGPAGEHASTGNKAYIGKSLSSDVCAPCHFSSDRHGKGYAWQGSLHAISINNGSTSSVESFNRRFCNRCHTGQGYLNQTVAGLPEPVVNTPSNKIWDNVQPVTCQVCHDPHDGSNPMQLRTKTIGESCLGCHTVRLSSNLHAAHQGPMLVGADGKSFSLADVEKYRLAGLAKDTLGQNMAAYGSWGGWQLPGKYPYVNSAHSGIQERCVACHMAKSPSFLAAEASNFSKPDTMMNQLGGHTFKVVASVTVGASTVEVLNTTGCQECHGTVSMTMIEDTQIKTKALLQKLYNAMPVRDTVASTTSAGISFSRGNPVNPTDTVTYQNKSTYPHRALTSVERAAAYNYYFVNNDGSFGVHNFRYAEALIMNSIEQLQLGAGAVTSFSIADRKNDNGRYLRVAWNPFPAEKDVVTPVTSYLVMVRVNVPLSGSVKKVASTEELIAQAQPGKVIMANGVAYMPYGPIPAIGQNLAKDVPTDADSAAAGKNYTAVYIAGLTASGKVFASPMDSNYSVANFAPVVGNMAGALANGGVTISWNPPAPVDDPANVVAFKYDVFRSTTQNFDVTGQTPVGAGLTTSQFVDKNFVSGTKYYYKVVAIAGTARSTPSVEVSLTATGVAEDAGMPTEFALKQNYPNPFNPSTEIGFALPQSAHVRISIYNVAGVEVKTLVDEVLGAGNKKVTWNGRDNKGQTVASGVYLYRIQAGDFVSTMKMVMMK